MWPFALLSIGVIPLMGIATAYEMKRFLGEDEGGEEVEDGCDSPGGIIVETLLNIRTVSALNLEDQRFKDYTQAIEKSEGNLNYDSAVSGALSGFSVGIQQVSSCPGSTLLPQHVSILISSSSTTNNSGLMPCSFGGEDGLCLTTPASLASRTSSLVCLLCSSRCLLLGPPPLE